MSVYFENGRPLFVAGKVAASADCCCVERACGACPPGTVPPFLKLTWGLYGPTSLPPTTARCDGANVGDVLLEHDPDITESLVTATFTYPICAYRYYFPEPVGVPAFTDIYGWGAELVDFSGLGRINLYPLDGDGGMWKAGTADAQDWTYWIIDPPDVDCDGWTAGYFTATPGLITFSPANSHTSDPNCHYDGSTVSLVPFYP